MTHIGHLLFIVYEKILKLYQKTYKANRKRSGFGKFQKNKLDASFLKVEQTDRFFVIRVTSKNRRNVKKSLNNIRILRNISASVNARQLYVRKTSPSDLSA